MNPPTPTVIVPLVMAERALTALTVALRQGAFTKLDVRDQYSVLGTILDLTQTLSSREEAEEAEGSRARARVTMRFLRELREHAGGSIDTESITKVINAIASATEGGSAGSPT